MSLGSRAFAAVMFDLDGTLIDSTGAIERSWASWARHFGLEAFEVGELHGRPAAHTIAKFLPGREAEGTSKINELEEADLDGICQIAGAAAALSSLPDERRAIVTSGHRTLATGRLVAGGLPVPRHMITSDDITHGKPHPEPYLKGAALLGVDPSDCLVIEDANAGLASARAAGCATLAVASRMVEGGLDADVIVPDLTHVRFEVGEDGVRVAVTRSN